MQRIAIGVDIGGTKIDVAVVNEYGGIISKLRERTDMSTPQAVVKQAARMARVQLRDLRIPLERVAGVGICLPSVVDYCTGRLVWTPPHLPQWARLPFRELFESELRKPVYLQYDGHACALAEQWLGACKGVSNAVVMIIGTGVGGGLILNGEVYRGTNGIAGAIGWMVLDRNDLAEQDSTLRGCLEAQISGTAIVQRAKGALEKSGLRSILSGDESLTASAVFDAAEAGDQVAEEIVEGVVARVGAAIASIVSLLDIEVIVLGGGVGRSLSVYLPKIKTVARQYTQPIVAANLEIKITELNDDMGVLGAAKAVFLGPGYGEHGMASDNGG